MLWRVWQQLQQIRKGPANLCKCIFDNHLWFSTNINVLFLCHWLSMCRPVLVWVDMWCVVSILMTGEWQAPRSHQSLSSPRCVVGYYIFVTECSSVCNLKTSSIASVVAALTPSIVVHSYYTFQVIIKFIWFYLICSVDYQNYQGI